MQEPKEALKGFQDGPVLVLFQHVDCNRVRISAQNIGEEGKENTMSTRFFALAFIPFALILGACSPRQAEGPSAEEVAQHQQCMSRKQEAMKHMDDMCAQRLSSLAATRQEVEGALNSKKMTDVKAALAKAAAELRRTEENVSTTCDHMKMTQGMPCMKADDQSACGKDCRCRYRDRD